MGQGDAKGAAAILSRAPAQTVWPELAHAAAESYAPGRSDDARACAVAEALGSGRDETYWLRLRTYCCQAIGGQSDQAQLTFDLAQSQAMDPVFVRLIGAKASPGRATSGAPSLRNGLDYALSRSLGLDLAAAKPSAAIAGALATGGPSDPEFDAAVAPALHPMWRSWSSR